MISRRYVEWRIGLLAVQPVVIHRLRHCLRELSGLAPKEQLLGFYVVECRRRARARRAPRQQLGGYFCFHGLRGSLLMDLGRSEEARSAFDRSIGLANTPAEAAHIRQHLDKLSAR